MTGRSTLPAIAAGLLIGAAGPAFEPAQPQVLTGAGTVVNAFGDYDGDGDPDLFVGLGGAPNRLYRNDRGTLKDVALEAGVASGRATRAGAWGDFDADGDPDLLVGIAPGDGGVLRLFRNDRGTFVDVTAKVGLDAADGAVRQPVWIDFDGDSDLDLFVAFRDRPNALFRNTAGRFTDVAGDVGLADPRRSVGAVWFDYDEDGDLDASVAHMDGDANALYRNDAGRFTDVAEAAGVAWGGRAPRDPANGTVRPCAADVNNDGRLDLFFANYGPNGLFLNRPTGAFENVSAAWGIAVDSRYDTCAFSDIDHDGRLDLYVNGTVTGGRSYPDLLFRNAGTRFEDVTPGFVRGLNADHGAQWADFDGDGDEDLALTGVGAVPMPLLLRNQLPAPGTAQSVKVRVVDGRGMAVRAGAEVRLYAAGTRRLLGVRLVDAGSGYNAQNDLPVHFGVPGAERVDVEVLFPAGGRRHSARQPGIDPRARRGPVVVRVGLE